MRREAANLQWERLTRAANQAARGLAKDWPGIDRDDIRSEIISTMAGQSASLAKLDDKGLFHAARRVGRGYCGRERYAYTWHSAQYVYTPAEVRALFATAFFEPELWEQLPRPGDGVTIEADGIVVALWDLSDIYDRLSPDHKVVVAKRYERGEALNEAERRRLSRAIDEVCRRLNRRVPTGGSTPVDHDGPGARKAVRNSAAQAMTGREFDG